MYSGTVFFREPSQRKSGNSVVRQRIFRIKTYPGDLNIGMPHSDLPEQYTNDRFIPEISGSKISENGDLL